MKPIFFPFTFLSDPVIEELKYFFEKTVVYQPASEKIPDPVRRGADEGALEICAPVGGDEQKLEQLLYQYRQWLDRHQGSEMTFFKTRLFDSFGIDTVPGFSDSSTSQIKADIKKMGKPEATQRPDPLFTARFFLWVAQEFDIQHYDINRDLEIFRDMEKELFSSIIGESEDEEITAKTLQSVITEDPGQYKTFQRLTAWLKLFEQDPVEPDDNGTTLLITQSSAVLDYLLGTREQNDAPKILETGPMPIKDLTRKEEMRKFRENLMNDLSVLSKDVSHDRLKEISGARRSGKPATALEIYAFAESPWSLLAGENQKEPYDLRGGNSEKFKKTFVGVVGHR